MLLIGSYREDEGTPSSSLATTLDRVSEDGAGFVDVTRVPVLYLDAGAVRSWVGSLLSAKDGGGGLGDRVGALAEIVVARTGGNPLFMWEFLTAEAKHQGSTESAEPPPKEAPGQHPLAVRAKDPAPATSSLRFPPGLPAGVMPPTRRHPPPQQRRPPVPGGLEGSLFGLCPPAAAAEAAVGRWRAAAEAAVGRRRAARRPQPSKRERRLQERERGADGDSSSGTFDSSAIC